MRPILFCLAFLISWPANAQDECVCCDFRQRGQVEYDAGRYEVAIEKWQLGKKASDAPQCSDLDARIAQARKKITDRDAATRRQREQEIEFQRLRDKADDDLWDVLKDGDAVDCDKYLAKYPDGHHARAARDRKAQLAAAQPAPAQFSSMVRVEGGTFQMGDLFGEGRSDETAHPVAVSTFYISKTEVTFEEYNAFCAGTGRMKPADQGWGRGRRPVIQVDWYDAVEYCNWRSTIENLTPVYRIDKSLKDPGNENGSDPRKWKITPDWTANGYRLPTEAEWEFAARAASSRPGESHGGAKVRFGNSRDIIAPGEVNFYALNSVQKSYSVAGEYRRQTISVDELPANALGLRHMSGNVAEWCWDWYEPAYYFQSDGAQNPLGPNAGQFRCVRGGSWNDSPVGCRAADRSHRAPYENNDNLGFRVVRR